MDFDVGIPCDESNATCEGAKEILLYLGRSARFSVDAT